MILIYFTGCSATPSTSYTAVSPDKNKLIVHYIDVGQADSILIQVNGKNMLIDAGNKEDGDNVVAYLKKQGVKKLDYILATHPHEDHIGGMSAVIKKFPIGDFYAPKKTNNTKIFEDMITALKGKQIKIAKAGVKLDLGEGVDLLMLAPNSDNYGEDLNNYSAVVKLTYGTNKFLFMGDAEKLSEKEILYNNFDVSCDVLKVGHHGSSSSSSKDFLDKASPKSIVISVGKGNTYGHPNKETLSGLKKETILFIEPIWMVL